ncbi:MAG: hypothetical protein ACRD0Y_00670 [Terriglobales bacterium]
MKTTVELPDDLMVEVKVAAARRRVSLRAFFESALRRAVTAKPPRRPLKPMKLTTTPGGLAPGFDVSNREKMYEWFDKELDRS